MQDELYAAKRELAEKFREQKDHYHQKIAAIRQARNDRFKAEKAKEDAARREEEIVRLREEARAPAYAAEIEDARILINYFAGKYGVGEVPETSASAKEAASAAPSIQGVKAIEVRKVEADFKGMQLKKKDEELEGFFGGSKKKKGGKKGGASAGASGAATPSASAASESVNLPMNLLSALLAFGISPPSNKEDVARTVTDLETKKTWFEANSEAKTKVGGVCYG